MAASVVEDAIAALRRLSPERQEELARYICELAGDDRTPEEIDPAHAPAVMEGLAQVDRGELASPERVSEALRRFGK